MAQHISQLLNQLWFILVCITKWASIRMVLDRGPAALQNQFRSSTANAYPVDNGQSESAWTVWQFCKQHGYTFCMSCTDIHVYYLRLQLTTPLRGVHHIKLAKTSSSLTAFVHTGAYPAPSPPQHGQPAHTSSTSASVKGKCVCWHRNASYWRLCCSLEYYHIAYVHMLYNSPPSCLHLA